jgi:hypothetical protein
MSGLCAGFQFPDDALSEHLSELDAPLIERVDVPDDALGENAVFIKRHQLPERSRRQLFEENGV